MKDESRDQTGGEKAEGKTASGEGSGTFNVGGDVIGREVKGDHNVFGKDVKVIQHINQQLKLEVTSENVGNLIAALTRVSTSIPLKEPAGIEGARKAENPGEAMQAADDLLGLLDARGGEGVRAGSAHLSRVELLLKKAILLKTEADQMYFDQMAGSRGKLDPQADWGGGRELDLAGMFEGFDESGHQAKLKEVHDLLQEARGLDPTNTEVLLHLGQLLIEFTPDDPTDEERVLYQAQNLLRNPKDDDQRFQLAQVTFLLATSREPIRVDSLKDARRMFAQLGREDWVRQCDDLLASAGMGGGDPQGGAFPPSGGGGTPMDYQGDSMPAGFPGTGGFQPVGSWHIQVLDGVGSVLSLALRGDGGFDGTQQTGPYGPAISATGRWAFDPFQRLLQFQGLANGIQPFLFGIFLQQFEPNQIAGTGTDGFRYLMTRVG